MQYVKNPTLKQIAIHDTLKHTFIDETTVSEVVRLMLGDFNNEMTDVDRDFFADNIQMVFDAALKQHVSDDGMFPYANMLLVELVNQAPNKVQLLGALVTTLSHICDLDYMSHVIYEAVSPSSLN